MSKQTKLTFKHRKNKQSKKRQRKAKTATKKPSNYNVAPPVPTVIDSSPVTVEELKAIREMETSYKYKAQVRGVIRSLENDNSAGSKRLLQQHYEQELSISIHNITNTSSFVSICLFVYIRYASFIRRNDLWSKHGEDLLKETFCPNGAIFKVDGYTPEQLLQDTNTGMEVLGYEQVMIFFLARVHETWMKESFSDTDRYLLWQQCNCTKHFQMHLIDSSECFVL